MAARLVRVEGHALRLSYTPLGTSPIAGWNTPKRGTVGRCECREWQSRYNVAPSRGGNTEVRRRHQEHLKGLSA